MQKQPFLTTLLNIEKCRSLMPTVESQCLHSNGKKSGFCNKFGKKMIYRFKHRKIAKNSFCLQVKKKVLHPGFIWTFLLIINPSVQMFRLQALPCSIRCTDLICNELFNYFNKWHSANVAVRRTTERETEKTRPRGLAKRGNPRGCGKEVTIHASSGRLDTRGRGRTNKKDRERQEGRSGESAATRLTLARVTLSIPLRRAYS